MWIFNKACFKKGLFFPLPCPPDFQDRLSPIGEGNPLLWELKYLFKRSTPLMFYLQIPGVYAPFSASWRKGPGMGFEV